MMSLKANINKITQYAGRRTYSLAILVVAIMSGCSPVLAQPTKRAATVLVTPTAAAAITSTMTPVATVTPTAGAMEPELWLVAEHEQPDLGLAAGSAVLIDAASGEVLYHRQAHERMYPASTTKILTALLALEHFEPEEMLWVGEEANLAWRINRLDAQKAGLEYGLELPVRDLLYGLLLPSGSDAALVLAANVAYRASNDYLSVDEALANFSEMMNERARAAGALESNFTNPDGIHDPNHYSTAYDLALIAREAMQYELFREIVATGLYETDVFQTRNGSFSRSWENTNRLIDRDDSRYYPFATGVKTGTTTEAGYCLVSSAEFDGRAVIAVVLNSGAENVWSDSVTLLEYARSE
jgi:D-alanyl-D-alanine carboxypeptidase (penicillin-binding protein 5/6)